MRAVRLHAKGDLRVEQIKPPKSPVAGEMTLAVRMAGICGSDLHNYKTGAWISRAGKAVWADHGQHTHLIETGGLKL